MLRGLLSFRGSYRILNLAWIAFFLTFVVWFNYAPFATTIRESTGLTVAQAHTIGLCNLALTIPARIIIGGAGATFGIAPLLKRSVMSQITGNIGAYGSVGSVIYATSYSLLPQTPTDNQAFFQILGCGALVVCCLCALVLQEPVRVAKLDRVEEPVFAGH